MILKGKITILKYQSKTFKNDQQEVIPYTSVEFIDDEYNKFTATVPKDCIGQIGLELDTDVNRASVEGNATFEITPTKVGPKFKLVEFIPN